MKKTPEDVIILHKCTKNHDHMLYCSSDMCDNVIVIFHFGLFFALLPEKLKFKKMKKTPKDIIILHMCTKNHDQMMYGS